MLGGIYDDPATTGDGQDGFHPGKAVGVDVTVLLQNWLAVRVGVPVYIDPVAVGAHARRADQVHVRRQVRARRRSTTC